MHIFCAKVCSYQKKALTLRRKSSFAFVTALPGAGFWRFRITDKHRLVYRIFETEVVVLVLTAYGHYEDK